MLQLELQELKLPAEAQRLVLQREPGQVLQELESQQGARAGS